MRFSVNLTKIFKIALLKFSVIIYGNRLKRISKKREKEKERGQLYPTFTLQIGVKKNYY